MYKCLISVRCVYLCDVSKDCEALAVSELQPATRARNINLHHATTIERWSSKFLVYVNI